MKLSHVALFVVSAHAVAISKPPPASVLPSSVDSEEVEINGSENRDQKIKTNNKKRGELRGLDPFEAIPSLDPSSNSGRGGLRGMDPFEAIPSLDPSSNSDMDPSSTSNVESNTQIAEDLEHLGYDISALYYKRQFGPYHVNPLIERFEELQRQAKGKVLTEEAERKVNYYLTVLPMDLRRIVPGYSDPDQTETKKEVASQLADLVVQFKQDVSKTFNADALEELREGFENILRPIWKMNYTIDPESELAKAIEKYNTLTQNILHRIEETEDSDDDVTEDNTPADDNGYEWDGFFEDEESEF